MKFIWAMHKFDLSMARSKARIFSPRPKKSSTYS